MSDTAPFASVSQAALSAPPPAELVRPPLLLNQHDLGWFTDRIAGIAEGNTPRWWWMAFIPSLLFLMGGVACVVYLITTGVGVWGLNHPVTWAWDVTNFVFWIGIGHAGTLISAVLFLMRQKWRTSINRVAEAMTLFAVICATIFPLIHLGRAWHAWWLLPIPTSNALWPQFRSPLVWDVFAIATYFIVSLMFWHMGMVPDLAAMRDRATTRIRKFLYGLFALGWTGSNRHWHHYDKAYFLLAGLATALVISVHSIVSFDFAVTQLPGWHSTLFPPCFVAGAIFSGMGMVMTLIIPLRALCRLEDVITLRHIDLMCKVTLGAASIIAYAYAMEAFTAWYSGNPYELGALNNRLTGPFAWAAWIAMLCNIIAPQCLWFKSIRANVLVVFLLSIVVNIGMWFERFVIIATTLARDYMPANWGYFTPTWVDVFTFTGSIGLFLTMFLLFIRFVPLVAIAEVKGITPQADPAHPLGGANIGGHGCR